MKSRSGYASEIRPLFRQIESITGLIDVHLDLLGRRRTSTFTRAEWTTAPTTLIQRERTRRAPSRPAPASEE
jgi:hypothetical protein